MSIAPGELTLRTAPRGADVAAVRGIVESTGFFHDHEVAVAVELVEETLAAPGCGYLFVFADAESGVGGGGGDAGGNGGTVGYACFGEIPCTRGSYDLYWIAVHARVRGGGIGRTLLVAAEGAIAARGGRRVYIETSGRGQYAPTRAFYERCGYAVEATLRDFYAPGDDKLIYSKVLPGC